MKYAHLATRLYNTPLLITPEKAAIIEAFFRARAEGRGALESPAVEATKREQIEIECAAQGMQRADGGYWRTTGGVALIPVMGTLVHRADSLDAMSGLVGYTRLGGQLQSALDDPRIDAILLHVDSPGGEVNGLADLTAKISAAGKKKPTWAIADEWAFSAAYWLASAAEKLYVPQTGLVGSIGVYMLHQDQSQKNAKNGVSYTFIKAGDRKTDLNPHEPLSDDARALAQARVDEIYGLFVETVATNRGVDEQAVRDTEAGILNTKAALDVGLIDGVASFDETLAALTDEAQKFRMRGRVYSPAAAALIETISERADDMANEKTFTQADLDAARAAGKSEGEQAANAAAKVKIDEAEAATKAAANAATDRIKAITQCEEAKTRPQLAAHLAYETKQTADEAKTLLAKAAPETAKPTNPLDAALRGTNPNVGADADAANAEKKHPKTSAEVIELRNKQAGLK